MSRQKRKNLHATCRGRTRRALILLLLAAGLLAAAVGHAAFAEDPMELLRRGDYKAAFEALSREIEEYPRRVELRIQLAELYIMFGKFDVAKEVLTRALELDSDNPTIHTDLGIVYEQTGEPSKALLEQIRATELSPDHPTAFNNLGHTYLTLGIPRKARENLKKAILINSSALLDLKSKMGILPKWNDNTPNLTPDQTSILTFYLENIAYAYMGMNNTEKALENLREALEYDPENEVLKQKIEEVETSGGNMLDNITETPLEGEEIVKREKTIRKLLLSGNTDDSCALIEDMLGRGVDSAPIRTAHGIVLQAMGDVEGAAKEYKMALELEPDHMPALANLGFVSEYKGLFDESIEHYTRALEIEPDNAMLHNNLGHT
ncbi:MAG: tetratricopeptide repeat protein, partial [bacterium]